MGGVLVRGDVQLFPPAHVGPHGQGALHVGAPEVIVPHRPPGQPHPGTLEAQRLAVQHVAPGGDVQPGGLRVAGGDPGVQGMDALEDGDLVLAQLQGSACAVVAHLPGKLKFGNDDLFPPGELGEVLIQQGQVHHLRGLVVDLPVGRAGGGLGVLVDEVVIHGDGVAANAPALQFPADHPRRGGLARAGGPGQQHHGAVLPVAADEVRRRVHLVLKRLVALSHKTGRVPAHRLVDLLELIGHSNLPFRSV